MSIEEFPVASVWTVTANVLLKYAVNFHKDYRNNGDRLVISTQATPTVVKISGLGLKKDTTTATGSSSAAVSAKTAEGGTIVISLPAYSSSLPIQLPQIIDYLDIRTDPVVADGVCVSLLQASFNGQRRTSDFIY